jgi:hypothetical protein
MPKPRRLAALGAFAAAMLAGLVVEWAKDFPVTSWTWRGLVGLWRWLRGSARDWIRCLALDRALEARAQPPWLESRKDAFLGLEWAYRLYSHSALEFARSGIPAAARARRSHLVPSPTLP